MAAIYDENGSLDMNRLSSDIKEHLPTYARPQFIRILTKIDLTGNFSHFNLNLNVQIHEIILYNGKIIIYRYIQAEKEGSAR